MSIQRFGKHSAPLLREKKSFFNENDLHLGERRKIADLYMRQPQRNHCKNCGQTLGGEIDFLKDGVGYVICRRCTHLNGCHEDTAEFCRAVYSDDFEEEYARTYLADDKKKYESRVAVIYQPKAEFLYSSLVERKLEPAKLKYADFSAGSGHEEAGY